MQVPTVPEFLLISVYLRMDEKESSPNRIQSYNYRNGCNRKQRCQIKHCRREKVRVHNGSERDQGCGFQVIKETRMPIAYTDEDAFNSAAVAPLAMYST